MHEKLSTSQRFALAGVVVVAVLTIRQINKYTARKIAKALEARGYSEAEVESVK